MMPERCKRCGWMDGMRPDTCYEDDEHDFEPIPETEWTPCQRQMVDRKQREAEHAE